MKLLATSTAIAMACVLSTSALAQDKTLEPVVENASDINESAREAQLTVDKISDSMQERMQQYKQIMKEIEGLQVFCPLTLRAKYPGRLSLLLDCPLTPRVRLPGR